MNLTAEEKQFIRDHASDDANRLLLGAKKYPQLDVPFLVDQILSRRQIREKLPSWYANEDLVFPAKIAAEQCSSERTALYKQRLVSSSDTLCDLTGGLGIDSYFFSRKVSQLTYIERFPVYCEAARHNFQVLGADNITVRNENSVDIVSDLPEVDVFYLDPARRGEGNKRVFALSDCEPDLPRLLPLLLQKAPRVIAKLSPMADLQQTESLLPGTVAIHVLSVRNECKELLFDIRREAAVSTPPVYCVDFTTTGTEHSFTFTVEEERNDPLALAAQVGTLVAGFPGRTFRVEKVLPFSNKVCKSITQEILQANITVRNFPMSVDELRKKTKIQEGGDVYLFATTLSDGGKVLVVCRKVSNI